ncbi:hypothetical protein RHVG_00034 [Rhodovulum phage RS1]|uniref:portal protein n=1 Tax=Rhodobacter phage RC1 TaxID=754055 RepID=UPI0002C18718|nr:portal protein [Rhodobacter phage RC1]YP_007676413.1 portal protein [Rhodovulum phage RS1]AGH57999.1 hypothetical protein RHVG_00034 [Rhodovulum phage RS1]AGH58043.1 hypothetical protein RHWG_00022 [Rhodobacter phage RC1]
MAQKPVLLDRWGNPVQRAQLTEEVAAPTVTGVRSPLSGYPGDGLNPLRLAQILRAADHGDPVRYLDLAEVIEERDPHYLGVIGTRKRSVSQLDITVEPASDDPQDVKIADMVRDWLKREELQQEVFHILDCISKGYSFTEIVWNTSEGQYFPDKLIWRDPRHFRFQKSDLATPLLLDDNGAEVPLPAFRFIFADIPAKSGILLRSGLARVAAWGWMFKAFTARDWAIFTQTYGQPLRIGKWQPGASEQDKDTLFRAVANIAGDCAAIIPETMSIDFVESKSIGSSVDLYEKRINHLDQQISKAVLGQTTTTDAVAGGHAVSQEHRLVQEDIETSDAMALAAILNRDLIRPWIQLEYGPQKRYPRIKIARPKTEDLTKLASSLDTLVRLGMEIEENEVRSRFGFSQPKPGAKLLRPLENPATQAAPPGMDPGAGDLKTAERKLKPLSGQADLSRGDLSLNSEMPSTGQKTGGAEIAALTDQLELEGQPEIVAMIEEIRTMLEAASSLGEFSDMLDARYGEIGASQLASRISAAMLASEFAGREGALDG